MSIYLVKTNILGLRGGNGDTFSALNDIPHDGLELEDLNFSQLQSQALPCDIDVRDLLQTDL